MLNEESKTRVKEFAREMKALLDQKDLIFWQGGIVRVAPVGAPPVFCTVEIQDIWDENVEWRGTPGGLVAGDAVLVWEDPVTHRREIIGASGAGACTPFVHDHSLIIQGGDALNPATFSPQTFVVGPAPCLYPTVSAAVVAVNAFGPGAANPCTIRVQGIYTAAEAGDVIIPSYCYIEGVGDGSVIDLGANRVRFSDHSGALDIVFTSSRIGSYVVGIPGVTDVELRNVKSIATNQGWCFNVGSSTDVRLFDCIAEATIANSRGFYISGTADDVDLEGCTADTTNFAFAFYASNTGTVITKYCTFKGTVDVRVDAGTDWQHFDCRFDPDNCPNITAGTHTALPTKRFNQELIVAEEGGDFQALSEAVTWINNQADAAAGKLYGVLMLGGNFAEAANVTIPQYVHVCGQGRGTEIEMGNKVLSLSDDSSLKDVTVETTMDATTKYCINCDGITGYELFNVLVRYTPHTSGACVGFYFHGASDGAAYHCVADPLSAPGGTVDGFAAEDSAVVLLWDCEADDTTNLDRGLYIGDTADVQSKHCTFRAKAAGSDVLKVAGATFSQVGTETSPANITIPTPGANLFLPRIRDTVGCAIWNNANQPIASGAWVPVTHNSERWDDAQAMGVSVAGFHNPAVNPSRITIPVGFDGRYNMAAHGVFAASALGTTRGISILLNGATYLCHARFPFSAGMETWMTTGTPYNLAAGDFVEMVVFQDTGALLNLISWSATGIEFRIERK